jgi:hypothetical protein
MSDKDDKPGEEASYADVLKILEWAGEIPTRGKGGKRLSEHDMARIAEEIRAGKQRTDNAVRMLYEFVQHYDDGEEIPPPLLRHVRDSFADYLLEERPNLNTAFGTNNIKRGRSKHDPEDRIKLATAVWHERLLEKMDHISALISVNRTLGNSESVIGEAWAEYKHEALIRFFQKCERNGIAITPEIEQRASEIVSKPLRQSTPEK